MGKLQTADKYQVIRATKRNAEGVNVDGHASEFGTAGAAEVVDRGLAEEINARYGPHGEERPGEVVVVPMHGAGREVGHRYSFLVPELPWKKKPQEEGDA